MCETFLPLDLTELYFFNGGIQILEKSIVSRFLKQTPSDLILEKVTNDGSMDFGLNIVILLKKYIDGRKILTKFYVGYNEAPNGAS